jgi:hypothetical protein
VDAVEVVFALDAVELTAVELTAVSFMCRYQFATGSLRHSPTVTILNPAAVNCWSMNSVRL